MLFGGLRAAIDGKREQAEEEPRVRRAPLGQVLRRQGYISDEEINRALAKQAKTGKLIGEILVEDGVVSRSVVSRALDEQGKPEAEGEAFFGGLRDAIAKNAAD
jgi:hypothetical protein